MAAMWPARIRADTQSKAERKLFSVISLGLNDDWTCLHSVGLTSHDRKPWAEIDFVLVGPAGVFCLEVKGGRVRREGARWIFTDGDGNEGSKHEGPFEQVGPAAAKLRNFLVDQDPGLRDVLVGYAVATPDITFRVAGPDIDLRLVYDERDAPSPFSRFVQRVTDRWHERLGSKPPTSRAQRARIVQLIRGDFDLRPALATMVHETEQQLVRLTETQARAIRQLAGNRRILVNGGAGTGKTFLAVAEAERLADAGQRILLTCFSARLARRLAAVSVSHPMVTVQHVHALMTDIVDDHGLEHRLPQASPEDLRAVFLPELALEALLDEDVPRFDAIIVDEAQDVLSPPNLDVFDALLAGGLTDGIWRVFYDGNQNVFSGVAPAAIRKLRSIKPTELELDTNCRNTMPIATNTAMLARVRPEEVLTVEGPEVDFFWYRNTADQGRQVGNYLARLISGRVAPKDIVVLSRLEFARSGVRTGELPGLSRDIKEIDEAGGNDVRFSTIAEFKGLESPIAVVIDVADLDDSDTSSMMYVAMSRAEVVLAVSIAEDERANFGELARTFGERFAVADTTT